MHDLRPVCEVTGKLTLALGLAMLAPMAVDLAEGRPNWQGFALAAFATAGTGALLMLASARRGVRGLTRHQAFLLTTLVWLVLPGFGALPFVLGAPGATYTDAFFEAMSGLTTTGSTVFSGLDGMARGTLLWRALLQWFGGLGIVVVAMVFLPVLKVGGMQLFRSESFDISGDILPRAAEAARAVSTLYLSLTLACLLAYSAAGMTPFDALCHAMTTIATGGLANYDASFGAFPPAVQWVGALFMALAALPFIKLVQVARGRMIPLWRDPQARAFFGILLGVASALALWRIGTEDIAVERAFRSALFNAASMMTGTGYASEDYQLWGSFAVALFFTLSLIGGCAGSTACSAKVFRFQILYSALLVQIRRIHTPHGVFPLRYDNRPVEAEVLSSVMGFFFVFVVAISILAMLLSMFGLSTITSISGAVAVMTNVGPGLGPEIGPAGNFAGLPDGAKWLLAIGMLLGRLECLSVLVLFAPRFWAR